MTCKGASKSSSGWRTAGSSSSGQRSARHVLVNDRAALFLAYGAALLDGSSTNIIFDSVKFGDPPERLAGDRRGTGRSEFVEAATDMCPAEGKRDAALFGEHAIAAITVDLQDSGIACEMSDRTFGLSVRRLDIGDARRIGSLPWPAIAGIGPELACLGLAASGIEHRRSGLVSEEFW